MRGFFFVDTIVKKGANSGDLNATQLHLGSFSNSYSDANTESAK